jgi:uncharacterized protein YigA (DUF484 family)
MTDFDEVREGLDYHALSSHEALARIEAEVERLRAKVQELESVLATLHEEATRGASG